MLGMECVARLVIIALGQTHPRMDLDEALEIHPLSRVADGLVQGMTPASLQQKLETGIVEYSQD